MAPIMKNAVEVSHFNSVCFKHKITLSSMNIWVLWICVRIEISNAVVTLHDWMLTSVVFFFLSVREQCFWWKTGTYYKLY